MSSPLATPRPPADPPMNLVLLGGSADLLPRLAGKLPAHWAVHPQRGDALDSLAAPPGSLMLLDFHHQTAAASLQLARQLQARRPELHLVAVGSTGTAHVEGVVAALRAGLRDFVDLEADAGEVQSVLLRALAAASAATAAVTGNAPGAATAIAAPAPLVLMLGVRGGMGSSTLAAHLAVLAQQLRGTGNTRDVLLLDLGQPAGDLALYLNIESHFHYDEAVRNAARIDATLARTAMARHACGLVVLDRASGSETLPPLDPAPLLQRLRGLFSSVLCELGGTPLRQIPPALLEQCDEVWLVSDPAIASLVSLDQLLHQLRGNPHLPSGRLQLVLNRCSDDDGLSPAQIAQRFQVPLLAALPDRPRLRNSASHGHLMLEDAPRDPYVRVLTSLLARLDPTCRRAEAHGLRDTLAHALEALTWKRK